MNRDIIWHIQDYGNYMRDQGNDGFSQFEAKKKLYRILWETQKQLEGSPHFIGEKEWIMENN